MPRGHRRIRIRRHEHSRHAGRAAEAAVTAGTHAPNALEAGEPTALQHWHDVGPAVAACQEFFPRHQVAVELGEELGQLLRQLVPVLQFFFKRGEEGGEKQTTCGRVC